MKKKTDSHFDDIEDLMNEISTDSSEPEGRFSDTCAPITIWVKRSYKADFDQLQTDTRKKFGKVLQKVVMKSIDRVKK